jgi:glycosyltransferase involved in cell wall biosynthesis
MNTSFFIPAYNCSKTIEEAVSSIVNDNLLPDDELVIVNDCSTDETAEVLKKLQYRYSSIKIVHNQLNKGGAATRNIAVDNCRHQILFCLDSDNILVPGSINKLRCFMQENNADVASFQELFYFKHDTNEIDYKWTFKTGEYFIEDHLSTTQVPGASGNYMFTKESWLRAGQYPEFAGALDTWGFGLRQVMTGSKVCVMPNSYYYHRYSHESYWIRDASRRMGSVSLRALQILIPFFDLLDDRDINYIMSYRGRYTWFPELNKRPIRLASNAYPKKIIWSSEENQKTGGKQIVIDLLRTIKNKIFTSL